MNDKKLSVIFIKWTEAAFIAAFFMLIKGLLIYFYVKSVAERLRWRLMLIMPIRKSKLK